MAESYLIVLSISCDDPDDDPRRWDFDALLAPPDDCPDRYVRYIDGCRKATDVPQAANAVPESSSGGGAGGETGDAT